MKAKLACADFSFPLLKHDQSLQLIAMLGIKGVDIGLFENRSHLQPSSEFKNLRRAARVLKKKAGRQRAQSRRYIFTAGPGLQTLRDQPPPGPATAQGA